MKTRIVLGGELIVRRVQMTDDYCNGLNIVPIDAGHFILSPSANSNDHPWRNLYEEREPPPVQWTTTPSTAAPPSRYTRIDQLQAPPSRASDQALLSERYRLATERPHTYRRTDQIYQPTRLVEPHETIRLCDVEAFRKSTAEQVLAHVERDWFSAIAAGISRFFSFFSQSHIRDVIYRYTGVVKGSFVLLEAIHFELFMPDRPDLRFLAFPLACVPSGTFGGHYFRIQTVNPLSNPSFGVKLGDTTYPVVFEIRSMQKMSFGETTRLAYVVKNKSNMTDGEVVAVSEHCDRDFSMGGSFPEQSLVRVISRDILPAHLYPVEPPKQKNPDVPLLVAILSFIWALLFGRRKEPSFGYLTRISGVRTSSQRAGRVTSAVEPSAAEAAWIEDRLGAFSNYGQFSTYSQDVQMMRELFGLGCVFRSHASSHADTKDVGETRIDESVILKTLVDNGICAVDACRPLLNCIYGRRGPLDAIVHQLPMRHGALQLNAAQSRAARAYLDAHGPRVFCIRSPPGSGKTTVASVMAASVAAVNKHNPHQPAQLLLSVQNVAVDNMGAALKKMDYGGIQVYNMKSTKKLDQHNPAPFDFFDLMSKERLKEWKNGQQSMERRVWNARNRRATMEQFESYEDCLDYNRREFEKSLGPKIILSTVELMLLKMMNKGNMRSVLQDVRRVIIDEASLLTEAALFAIIRRFPQARIVLIGDEKQLPPFMYDSKILGHELAGRSALSVAMRTGRVPVVELNEVYRAPPTLIAPYNRLAYGRRLVSKKAEGECPLSSIGLIHSGLPQLLLIDVDGKEERNGKNMSFYNTREIDVLMRLLKKFPAQWAKDVMIICLYKEQKWKLQNMLKIQNGLKQCSVLTVDSAQGKEAAIVILLTTRTQKATDFFCSTERCTVSVSRQQKALVILGKASLLTTNKPWSTVVNGDDFTRINAKEIK